MSEELQALADRVVAQAMPGEQVEAFVSRGDLEQPVRRRLAFRELGVAIGLQRVDPMRMVIEFDPHPFGGPVTAGLLLSQLDAVERRVPLVDAIECCWRSREGQASPTWNEHRDISMAMLAVSLAPDALVHCGGAGRRFEAIGGSSGGGSRRSRG